MPFVAAHPLSVDRMPSLTHDIHGFGPQLEIQNRAFLLLPSARHPAEDLLAHAFHEILRVAGEGDTKSNTLSRDATKCFNRTPDRHAVVRRRGLRHPVIP